MNLPSHPQRPTSEETRKRARDLEKYVRFLIDGQLTPGSGSKRVKGDVRSSLFLCECKYRWQWREKEGWFCINLPLSWIETISTHSSRVGKHPLLALEWGSGLRRYLIESELYSISSGIETYVRPGRAFLLEEYEVEYPPTYFYLPNISSPASKTWVLLDQEQLLSLLKT